MHAYAEGVTWKQKIQHSRVQEVLIDHAKGAHHLSGGARD